MHRTVHLALALAAALCAIGPLSCRGGHGNEVVLGVLAARTGDRALWGEDLYRGIELAVAQTNARGGLFGRHVRIAVEDDASSDERAGALVARLCEHEGAFAVMGEVGSGATERGAQAAQRHSVPFVSAGNTARDVTRVGDFVFRASLTDDEQASALARYARTALQKRRAAIVYRRSSLVNLAVADAFARAFRNAGGDVVFRETFSDDDAEMVHLAARVRSVNADVLFVPAQANDAARVALAARHGRVTAQLLGTDGWDAPELRRYAPDAAVGALITDAFVPGAPRREVEQFVEAFRARYRATPGTLAALGFDATRWVLSVAARTPSLEPRAMRDALAGSALADGVAGPLAVDARQHLTRQASVQRIERDGISFVASAGP